MTTAQFLEALKKSNLLSSSQFSEVKDFVGSDAKPEGVARQLIRLKMLTQWQAKRLLAGQTTFFVGNYKLLKRLGAGDAAAVFKAEQTGTRRNVALKVLPKELLSNVEAVERFRREVRATASLKHPHIVAAYDAGQLGDIHYLIMEYVGGRDLTAWLEQYTKLPIPWSCEVVRQIAEGLEHVHDAGLVHRDINPANILVAAKTDGMPWAKILDFGRVRNIAETQGSTDRLTVRGQTLGTQDYTSPEQMRNSRDADIRADIYSLGATFFRMLTGRVPHDDADPMKRMTALFSRDVPPASSLRSEIPPEVDGVIAKMLARDIANRYQTPNQIVEAIAPFALGSDEVLGADEIATAEEEPPIWTEDNKAAQIADLVQDQPRETNDSVYEFLAKLANQAKS